VPRQEAEKILDLRASLMQTKKIIDEMNDGKLDKKALH